jgi:hypothetical protein
MGETIDSMPTQIDHQELAAELLRRARAAGVELLGPGGLLTGMTKTVRETALEAEMSQHLGYDRHGPARRNEMAGAHGRTGSAARGAWPVPRAGPRHRPGRQRRGDKLARRPPDPATVRERPAGSLPQERATARVVVGVSGQVAENDPPIYFA